MIRHPLTPDDVVQVCMPTARMPVPEVPSDVIQCDECGCDMWRSRGRPLAQLTGGGGLRRAPAVIPEITRWLCIDCGAIAWQLQTGEQL